MTANSVKGTTPRGGEGRGRDRLVDGGVDDVDLGFSARLGVGEKRDKLPGHVRLEAHFVGGAVQQLAPAQHASDKVGILGFEKGERRGHRKAADADKTGRQLSECRRRAGAHSTGLRLRRPAALSLAWRGGRDVGD